MNPWDLVIIAGIGYIIYTRIPSGSAGGANPNSVRSKLSGLKDLCCGSNRAKW